MLNIDQDKTYHLQKAKIKIIPLLSFQKRNGGTMKGADGDMQKSTRE